ncbi:hypothetical protein GQ43DRAFT_48687 [Delitschia confertaspora ATCC 74209]|uniref:tRNA-splicing endonuclease subunit Sen2 n=1 Tax=Delitschia confertaspora ATCC 74209 TaxID=1513339 RepID=A0A9P4JKD5_9PLEO|nr:hypothetical protein GQ43DRAFT_48687 [Delitschia confertaspora ATCC 74209]
MASGVAAISKPATGLVQIPTVEMKVEDSTQKQGDSRPRGPPRPRRPNYADIHSRSLPLDVYPLPTFLPHNPLSLFQILYTIISQSIWTPSSRKAVYQGYFSPETQSVHVTDPIAIRALWEAGFFGKGTLSRSEPRWLDQEKRRRGLVALETSEEMTRKRREERRQFKLERARKERETIEQQLRDEGKLTLAEKPEEISLGELADVGRPASTVDVHASLANAALDAVKDEVKKLELEDEDEVEAPVVESPEEPLEISDQEHLQLTLEEAYFLTYALGSLSISTTENEGTSLLSNLSLLRLFGTYATFPISTSPISPDNPFLLKYVVYHHFRSLGWVVRPGVKFAVDYLLYNRGPVFAHAEFAVMILPSYSHPYWSETAERKEECGKKEKRDWWWLHRVNRVQTQVHKTLVLVYVEVPPPWDGNGKEGGEVDVGKVVKGYGIREVVLRRWTPNRNRG